MKARTLKLNFKYVVYFLKISFPVLVSQGIITNTRLISTWYNVCSPNFSAEVYMFE